MQNKGELCVQAQTNGTTSISDTSALLHGNTAHVNTQEINHFDGTFAAPPWQKRLLFYMSTEYKA
ncbi:hypothetical protein T05_15241 [Trichinella murrelli]|uniref:Uncharacterized protein n=1 Tax=Trichinella murrelli TaxID=144512 RepID=A0A0V0UH55_9BILA|nr:hypothetical protein T05_15241 [Trichinella murrelli]